jgi:hypothetical protein
MILSKGETENLVFEARDNGFYGDTMVRVEGDVNIVSKKTIVGSPGYVSAQFVVSSATAGVYNLKFIAYNDGLISKELEVKVEVDYVHPTATPTSIPTDTPVPTATNTPTNTATVKPAEPPTATPTITSTPIPTSTNTPVPLTNTPVSPTATATPTVTPTPTASVVGWNTPNFSLTPEGLFTVRNFHAHLDTTAQAMFDAGAEIRVVGDVLPGWDVGAIGTRNSDGSVTFDLRQMIGRTVSRPNGSMYQSHFLDGSNRLGIRIGANAWFNFHAATLSYEDSVWLHAPVAGLVAGLAVGNYSSSGQFYQLEAGALAPDRSYE